MSAIPGPFNPIVYAQFNLQGRWKKLLTFTFVYTLLIGGAIWLSSASDDPNRHLQSIKGWLGGLMTLQVLDLILFGSFRVESAVRGEITSRMIESHRLMPTPPLGSILGYICGAPLQAYLIAIANFSMGIVCCVIANVALDSWALVNATLLGVALFLYSIITQHSLLARGAFVILIIAAFMLVSGANDSGLIQMFPSLTVLVTPLIGRSTVFEHLFTSLSLNSNAEFAYICSMTAQAIIAAICIRIAIRRYSTANAIGVSPPLGLMLLAVWVGLSCVYFASPDSFQIGFRRGISFDGSEHTVAAFIGSFFVATLPISSAARSAWVARRTGSNPRLDSRFSIAGTAIIAGVIICCLLADCRGAGGNSIVPKYQTVLILLSFLVGVTCIFCWGYLAMNRAWVFAIIWIALTWAGPLIVNTVRQGMSDDTVNDVSIIPSFSPGGALAVVWGSSSINPMPGIIGQMVFAVIPVGLLIWARARQHKKIASS